MKERCNEWSRSSSGNLEEGGEGEVRRCCGCSCARCGCRLRLRVCYCSPYRAVKAFEVAAAQVQEKNSALQAEIDAAQQSLDKGCKPLDVATQDALTVAVADAGLALRAVPKISWCRVWGRCRGCQILSLSPKAMTPTGN